MWRAFWRLSADRTQRFVNVPVKDALPILQVRPGGIPYAAIDAYAARLGLEAERFETFLFLIDAMDREFLTIAAEKQSEASDG